MLGTWLRGGCCEPYQITESTAASSDSEVQTSRPRIACYLHYGVVANGWIDIIIRGSREDRQLCTAPFHRLEVVLPSYCIQKTVGDGKLRTNLGKPQHREKQKGGRSRGTWKILPATS